MADTSLRLTPRPSFVNETIFDEKQSIKKLLSEFHCLISAFRRDR
jgi:hypothetical protein